MYGAEAVAIAEAIKATGAIVQVDIENFQIILNKQESPLVVVVNKGGFLSKNYKYLTSYKGIFFYCKTPNPLDFPRKIEVILASKMWVPEYY